MHTRAELHAEGPFARPEMTEARREPPQHQCERGSRSFEGSANARRCKRAVKTGKAPKLCSLHR